MGFSKFLLEQSIWHLKNLTLFNHICIQDRSEVLGTSVANIPKIIILFGFLTIFVRFLFSNLKFYLRKKCTIVQ